MATTKWRAKALTPYGTGAISLSQIQLYAGATRVDTGATITCSHAPSSGSLANLQDSDTSTLCTFARADCLAPGFWIHWELAVAADLTGMKIGSGAVQNTFLSHLDLEYWGGTKWEPMGVIGRFAWPGANTVGTEITFTVLTSLTSALLHMDGTNGQNTNWVDSSNNKVPFIQGAACAYTTTASKFGATSLHFSSNYQYALVGATGSTLFDLQTEDFGIDLWVRPASITHVSNAPCLYSQNDGPRLGGHGVYLTNGKPNFFVENNTLGNLDLMATTVLALNTWAHIAITREGTTFRLFVNGIIEATATYAGPCIVSPNRPGVLGSYFYTGSQFGPFTGMIDEFRLVKGRAPWTANFTPPAAAYESVGGALPLPATAIAYELANIYGAVIPFTPLAVNTVAMNLGRDIYNSGYGVLYGTTEVDGSPDFPKVCKVRLHRERDGYVVSEQWSKADGTWRFEYLDMGQTYYVTAFDHTHDYRATIGDNLTPELMA